MTEVMEQPAPQPFKFFHELSRDATFLRATRIGGFILGGATLYAYYKTGSTPLPEEVTAEGFSIFGSAAAVGFASRALRAQVSEQQILERKQAIRANWPQTNIANIDMAHSMALARQRIEELPEVETLRAAEPVGFLAKRQHTRQLEQLETRIESAQIYAEERFEMAQELFPDTLELPE